MILESEFLLVGKLEWSTVTSREEDNVRTTEVGFTLSDDDLGDYFDVEVYFDADYGTPFFKTVAGASSCPWEYGTEARDRPLIIVNNDFVSGIPPDGIAEIRVEIQNDSPTQEARSNILALQQGSNPDGLQLSVAGARPQAASACSCAFRHALVNGRDRAAERACGRRNRTLQQNDKR
eukprot:2201872-Pleurochrysis_carterae.AAC.1